MYLWWITTMSPLYLVVYWQFLPFTFAVLLLRYNFKTRNTLVKKNKQQKCTSTTMRHYSFYLARSACLRSAIRCVDVTSFFLLVSLKTSLRMHWTDLHQIFRIDAHMGGLGGHDQSDLLFAIAQENLLW